MTETLKSVGIDIGTSTTQLVVSKLTLENRANPFSVPRIAITDREIIYRSRIHFTPLLSETVIDAPGVREIVAEEYRRAGLRRDEGRGRTNTPRKNIAGYYTLISEAGPPTWRSTKMERYGIPTASISAGVW